MNVVGGVVVGVLGGADERLKGRFGLGGVGEWSRLMHLNLPTSSWQLGSPRGLPFSFESLGGDGGSFLGSCHHVTWTSNTSKEHGTRA